MKTMIRTLFGILAGLLGASLIFTWQLTEARNQMRGLIRRNTELIRMSTEGTRLNSKSIIQLTASLLVGGRTEKQVTIDDASAWLLMEMSNRLVNCVEGRGDGCVDDFREGLFRYVIVEEKPKEVSDEDH